MELLDDLPLPTSVCGLDHLQAGTVENNSASVSELELALTVQPGIKNESIVLCDVALHNENSFQRPLELQNVDFLGPADVVKALLVLPYSNKSSLFAVHRMGNTLLIDTVVHTDDTTTTFATTQSETFSSSESPQNIWPSKGDMVSYRIEGLLATISSAPSSASPSYYLPQQDQSEIPPSPLHDQPLMRSPLHSGSPYLPPPGYFIPHSPQPTRQCLLWSIHEMRLAVGSDLSVYRTDAHPAITMKPLDASREVELSTCLDLYLDNVMANVPELALCLHAKGFLRGVRVLRTDSIPYLPSCAVSSEPMFDPKVIDFNASTILRFLRDNCRRDVGTYILRMSPEGEALHLYDLDAMSVERKLKWKWLLAMVSYRFAVRLGHHIKRGSAATKAQIRSRQRKLFSSSFQLLGEIHALGGEAHDSIRAAIQEHMADSHLDHAEEHRQSSSSHRKQSGATESEDEGVNLAEELQRALTLLASAVDILRVATCKEETRKHCDSLNFKVGDVTVPLDIPGRRTMDDVPSDDEGDDEGVVIGSSLMQLSGILHKAAVCACALSAELCRDAKSDAAVSVLEKLVPGWALWVRLRTKLLRDEAAGQDELWGECRTVFGTLPLLWDQLGAVFREKTRHVQRATGTEETVPSVDPAFQNVVQSVVLGLARLSVLLVTGDHSATAEHDTCSVTAIRSLKALLAYRVWALSMDAGVVQTTAATGIVSLEALAVLIGAKLGPELATFDTFKLCFPQDISWCLLSSVCASLSFLLYCLAAPAVPRAATEGMHINSVAFNAKAGGNQAIRVLAEACSVAGQRFLEVAAQVQKSNKVELDTRTAAVLFALETSEAVLSQAYLLFHSANDLCNQATVLCNTVSLLRFKSNFKSSSSGASVDEALKLLDEALKLCLRAHGVLGQRGSVPDTSHLSVTAQESVWDAVSYECGCTHLCRGVLLRTHLLTATSPPSQTFAVAVREREAVESLETALRIFSSLKSHRQIAASHFQLGALLFFLGNSKALERALLHYGEAHRYYEKWDVGSTLVLILLDMCDIHMASVVEEARVGRAGGSKNGDSQSKLRGALHALLECRIAFTPPVLAVCSMDHLAAKVGQRLASVLLRYLQMSSKAAAANDDSKQLRGIYKHLIQAGKEGGTSGLSAETACGLLQQLHQNRLLRNFLVYS